jgi:hypothetical protein
MGTSVTPGVGALQLTGFAPQVVAPTGGRLQHRLVIPGVGSVFTPGDPDPLPDTDFYITSRRRTTHPWIADDGEGNPDISLDGQRINPVLGHAEDGEVAIRVIDVVAPIATVACDVNDVLVAEGNAHLDDGTAFTTGGWAITEVVGGLTAPGWFGLNGFGEVTVSGFVLFGSGSWDGYIQKTFDGTEGGGPAWTPGQRVAVHARVTWGLDTGPGNLFIETEGGIDPVDGETVHRVSFPNGSYSFWDIPPDLAPNVYDTGASAIADASGEVIVRLGGENYGGSCNLNATFSDLEFFSCEDVEVAVGENRYVTGWLADDDARQQLLGRKAYLEESLDGGVTWGHVAYAGHVKQITMERSLTYLFTLGDSGRGRRVSRAWSGLNPVEDFTP